MAGIDRRRRRFIERARAAAARPFHGRRHAQAASVRTMSVDAMTIQE